VYTSGGLIALFAWLLCGDFAWSMRERSVGPMSQWYLTSLAVPKWLFGVLLTSFPALITIVLAPIISVKSDRHRGRLGRRIPFLLITTPLAAAGMVGLGLSPLISKWVHSHFPGASEATVAVLCFSVFWTAFELATIAGQSVFGGLINDVVPREFLGRFYGLFRAVALIDGIVFNYWLMGMVPHHFTVILVVIGVFYGVAFMIVCLVVKEGEYPPPPVNTEIRASPLRPLTTYLRECFAHPYYFAVLVMLMFAGLAFAPVNIFTMPYAASLKVDMDVYGKCLALTYAISLLLSFFLGWLADSFHPLRTAMFCLAGYAIVSVWGALYATTATTFLTAWVLHGVLSGCYFTSAASLGQRLFPRSQFAQFSSAAAIVISLGNVFFAPAMGTIIDTSGNYRYTFLAGCIISLTALAASLYVYGKFKALGGPANYVAP
jgi:MFS family permease